MIVTEVNPVRAIEAVMDGFQVMPMMEAARLADIIISATGDKDILRSEHLDVLKDGCVLGNSGHFDNEIPRSYLSRYAVSERAVRDSVQEYRFPDGRRAYLIAQGRLMNLGAGQGHPVEIMDMSFSIQALSLEYLVKHHKRMEPRVYDVPSELDDAVARIKLRTMGVELDELTEAQKRYLSGWEEGT